MGEEVPQPPQMPGMKMSQLAPLVVMLGMGKVDLDEMGYRRHAEFLFVLVQLVCLAVIAMMHKRISAMPEDGAKIHITEVKQMGQVVAPAKDQTAREYDVSKLKEQAQ